MYIYEGSCHCGDVRFRFETSRAPGEIRPKVCDCSFCRKHGAAWVFDPGGKLALERTRAHGYRQGSGSAEFLLCRNCGVLVAAIYAEGTQRWAAVNIHASDTESAFGPAAGVSPAKLDADERRAVWKKFWTGDVVET